VREVLDDLLRWWSADQPAGLATVVATWRSAPRPPGASMLVGPDGTAVGSVSGGCVEGALYELAGAVRDGAGATAVRYGVSDDDAFAVGLTCGGILDVYVERVTRAGFPELAEVAAAIRDGSPVAVATVVADRCAGADFAPEGAPPAAPPPAPRAEPPAAPPAESRAAPRVEPPAEPLAAPGAESLAAPRAERPSEPRAESPAEPRVESPAEPRVESLAAPRAEPPAGSRVGRRLVVWPDRRSGTLGSGRLDDAGTDDARGMLAAGRTGTIWYGHDGQRRGDDLGVFVAAYAPRPRLIVFGAIDFAAAVARVGTFLGFRVTVCDARPVFATRRRFPDADEVIVDWPHRYLAAEHAAGRVDERTAVCVLTHDPKFDVPVLEVALRLPLAYVGAMGSRRTHDDRLRRLRDAGLTDTELSRLASPIGLDIGARTPEETAVSVAAEIVQHRWGGTGVRLSEALGRIHHG
jgi:xanthine dehydrogenase accessory factor